MEIHLADRVQSTMAITKRVTRNTCILRISFLHMYIISNTCICDESWGKNLSRLVVSIYTNSPIHRYYPVICTLRHPREFGRPSCSRASNDRVDHGQISHSGDGSHGCANKILQDLQHLEAAPMSSLPGLRQLYRNPRPPLRLDQQLRWSAQLPIFHHLHQLCYTTWPFLEFRQSRSLPPIRFVTSYLVRKIYRQMARAFCHVHIRPSGYALSRMPVGLSFGPHGPWRNDPRIPQLA